jgi:putative transposase
MNRSARRFTLFEGPADYDAFVRLLAEAEIQHPIRLLCYVVMPNHWHLVLWPERDGDLSKYLGWLTGTHAVRWHLAHGSAGTGAIYQGRFKAVPVQSDAHFLSVCRYVERNPVRARLVERATDWRWSSAARLPAEGCPALRPWPVTRPSDWNTRLAGEVHGGAGGAAAAGSADAGGEDEEVRRSVRSGRPFGTPEWSTATALALGLPVRPRGRPAGSAGAGARPREGGRGRN